MFLSILLPGGNHGLVNDRQVEFSQMHQLKLRIVTPGSEVIYPLGHLLNLAIGAGIPDDDWYIQYCWLSFLCFFTPDSKYILN